MKLITPFDVIETFDKDKKVAVVGNAPTLSESGLGNWIDSHDIVVRFNDCRVFGHEEDVGSKTDILVCNPYAETRPDRRVGDAVAPRIVVAISSQTRRGDRAEFARWIGNFPVMFTYSPDIRINCGDRRKVSLTTGTYGLVLMANILRPSSLSVTGFTMFMPGTDFHYWSSNVPSGVRAHTPTTEAGIFADIINSFRFPVTVTSEVMQVFQNASKVPSRHVRQHGKRRWFGLGR